MPKTPSLSQLMEPPDTPGGFSQAQAGPDLQHVIATWWGQAMLDTDPDRDQIITAVQTGTLPTTTMAEVLRRRRANGAAMPGE